MTDEQFLLALFLGPPVLAGLGFIGFMAFQEWEAWRTAAKGSFMGWWLSGTAAVVAAVVGWLIGSAIEIAMARAAWSIATVTFVRAFLALVLSIGVLFGRDIWRNSQWRVEPESEWLAACDVPPWWAKPFCKFRYQNIGLKMLRVVTLPWWTTRAGWWDVAVKVPAQLGEGLGSLLGCCGLAFFMVCLKVYLASQYNGDIAWLREWFDDATLKGMANIGFWVWYGVAIELIGAIGLGILYIAVVAHIACRDAVWWLLIAIWMVLILHSYREFPEQWPPIIWSFARATLFMVTLATLRSLYLRVPSTKGPILVLTFPGIPVFVAALFYVADGHSSLLNDHPLWVMAGTGAAMALAWFRLRQIYPAGQGYLRYFIAKGGLWFGVTAVLILNSLIVIGCVIGVMASTRIFGADHIVTQGTTLFCVFQGLVALAAMAEKVSHAIPTPMPPVGTQLGRMREGTDDDWGDYLR